MTTSKPSIEALIVTYNSSGEIAECLAAAREAGVTAAVLDNASVDGTATLVSTEFPWVRLVRSEVNRGFAGGTNFLAASSRAEYLMPLNPDAILSRDTPGLLLSALLGGSEVIAAGPLLVYADGRRQQSNHRFPDLRFELAVALAGTRFFQFGLWDGDREVNRVMGWNREGSTAVEPTEALWATCWLMRASDVQRLGLFDERLGMYDEDLDFCTRMAARGRSFVYVPAARVVHYGGASSTSAEKVKLTRRARYGYYRLHRGLAYALGFRVMLGAIERSVRVFRGIKRKLKT